MESADGTGPSAQHAGGRSRRGAGHRAGLLSLAVEPGEFRLRDPAQPGGGQLGPGSAGGDSGLRLRLVPGARVEDQQPRHPSRPSTARARRASAGRPVGQGGGVGLPDGPARGSALQPGRGRPLSQTRIRRGGSPQELLPGGG